MSSLLGTCPFLINRGGFASLAQAQPDPQARLEHELWQERRIRELRELDLLVAYQNGQAVQRRRDMEAKIDRDAEILWEQHRQDYQRMIDNINRRPTYIIPISSSLPANLSLLIRT
jgi:hypothetical protein